MYLRIITELLFNFLIDRQSNFKQIIYIFRNSNIKAIVILYNFTFHLLMRISFKYAQVYIFCGDSGDFLVICYTKFGYTRQFYILIIRQLGHFGKIC